jgi:pyrroline-5-carboxylate reductase
MNTLCDRRLTIIEVGNIGRILLERLRAAGVSAEHLAVCDGDPARRQAAAVQFGVHTVSLTDRAASSADAMLIATPPKVSCQKCSKRWLADSGPGRWSFPSLRPSPWRDWRRWCRQALAWRG